MADHKIRADKERVRFLTKTKIEKNKDMQEISRLNQELNYNIENLQKANILVK